MILNSVVAGRCWLVALVAGGWWPPSPSLYLKERGGIPPSPYLKKRRCPPSPSFCYKRERCHPPSPYFKREGNGLTPLLILRLAGLG